MLLLQGCATLQTSWRDFNAYFNTYYNAKTSFERGLELQMRQEMSINPERPIRIHPTPHRAGHSDFEHAAQKSADVIRFHPRSRWVDFAIEMIGMSYFYQQQFFSADQKFVELLATTSNPTLRQRAILWRARSALELENYLEGINYSQSRLFSTEFDWDSGLEAELKLVIAQLYVKREEYEDAVVYLAEALPAVRDRTLQMRGHFLHGQLLEILQRYDEAFEAYSKATHRSNPSYDLIYHAELKLGITARKRGDLDWALGHFVSMSRDDRHFGFIATIEYEIARTMQERTDFTRSMQHYEQILRRRTNPPTRETQAKVYYGIAEIYRDFYQDYQMAAAYYDSSARQATDLRRLPPGFDASLMARSYGEYTRLQEEVRHLDSLLWLAGLSRDELNEVIEEVRQKKMAEMQEQEREQRRQQLVAIDSDEMATHAEEATESGFLNHKNPQMMQQMALSFQAVWGARPLVDDWRRLEAVRENIVRQFEEEGGEPADVDRVLQESAVSSTVTVEIDLSEIPFSEEEKLETRRRLASHEYEIGNVFYTALAMPDSAARYYRSVMRRFPDMEIAPQAIYSLSELYESKTDSVQALQYAMQLVDFYPNTIFAERMAARFNLNLERTEQEYSRSDSISLAYQEILAMNPSTERASRFRDLVRNWPEADIAAEALFRAVRDYIKIAASEEVYHYRIQERELAWSIWDMEKQEREAFRDSVSAMLADSLYMEELLDLQQRQDSLDALQIEAEAGTEVVPATTDSIPSPEVSAVADSLPDLEVTPEIESLPPSEASAVVDSIPSPEVSAVAGSLPDLEVTPEIDSLPDPEVFVEADTLAGSDLAAELDTLAGSDLAAELDTLAGSDLVAEPDTLITGQEEETTPEPPVKTPLEHLQEIASMSIEEPGFGEYFPYEGVLWDSARVVLMVMRNDYSNFPRMNVVNALAEEIEVDRVRAALVDTDRLYPCSELDEQPAIAGGLEQFIRDSGFQEIIDENMISGSLVVTVVIDQEGVPVDVYTEEEDDGMGIMEALLEAIRRDMRFASPEFTGVAVQAECEYVIEFEFRADQEPVNDGE